MDTISKIKIYLHQRIICISISSSAIELSVAGMRLVKDNLEAFSILDIVQVQNEHQVWDIGVRIDWKNHPQEI
jgi:hypothetical protein